MALDIIGKKIAALRKEKGVKQETLASYVGVTTQAVSKWENGGVPDTELLPYIADFFSVTVDTLFGRSCFQDSNNVHTALLDNIINTAKKDRFHAAFEFCWDLERSLFGHNGEARSISDCTTSLQDNQQTSSCILSDHGFTRMGLGNRMQYFLLVPEPKDADQALLDGIDYLSFFHDFSDPVFFSACIYLFKRTSNKAFTASHLANVLKIDNEKVLCIIDMLQKYNLIKRTEIELDDTDVSTLVYHFRSTPSFIALLIFAREMLDPPNHFNYYMNNRSKPYL